MTEPVIIVENLGKKFLIAHKYQRKHVTLRETLTDGFKKMLKPDRRSNGPGKGAFSRHAEEEFWALRNVNFEVKKGDRVGIIGRNGAGKSTLLKILSRISEPTCGKVIIDDRVASLLEIGTGFHPELTGRENIFLNGAILGMKRMEIRKKFDEIVDFAEIEKFLDTPVKRYSSGMYVRLAFAVAAHLEPEILIVDEVLAVGDARFQQKCLGKMEEVSRSDGRTILFVSHNMGAIRKLCRTGIYLDNGTIVAADEVTKVVDLYVKHGTTLQQQASFENYNIRRSGSKELVFISASLSNNLGSVQEEFFIGDSLQLEFSVRNNAALKTAAIGIQVKASDDTPILHMLNQDSDFPLVFEKREETFKITLHNLCLFPGEYSITLTATDPGGHSIYDSLQACIGFNIMEGGPKVNRKLPKEAGLIFLTPRWEKTSK
jgi:lipopolysaccharide transport system ATP-binding protein